MNEDKNIAKWYPYIQGPYDWVNNKPGNKPILTTHGRDEAERATEWDEIYGPMFMCSSCGICNFASPYCPECGSKMDFSIIQDEGDNNE